MRNTVSRFIGALGCALVIAAGVLAQTAAGDGKKTPDGKFTIEVEVPRRGVLSQGSTGTCWSFATVSFLESELERIHEKPFDLSEIYPVYFTYLEKARRYVRLHGKAQFSEGGLSHDIMHIARRHGVVPDEHFAGLHPDDDRHDHGEMAGLIEAMVKKLAASKKPSEKWEDAVRGVLRAYLGDVPEEIEVDGRTVTPRQYAEEVLRIPFDDYVEVMSFRYAPFWERAELLVPDNWMRYQGYLNVPVDAMMESLDHALQAGYSIAIDIDVSERGFRAGKGVATLGRDGEDAVVTDVLRQRLFDGRQTTDDHLMHVIGIARDEDGQKYYVTKNSWGPVGPYQGYLFMSEKYVALKTLGFMVHKDGLPKAVLEKVQP